MNSNRTFVIAGVMLAALAAVVVIVVAGGDKNSSGNDGMNMTKNNSTQSDNTKATATNAVTIENFAFSPAAITVKAGTKVTWTNKDSSAHTVTADNGEGPDSGNLAPGGTYSFTFNTPGTFAYHCSIHPSMTATVVVTQ